ncbi:coproporphyrinogen III oxidase [Sphingomonas sp. AP4-R1]|uniref:radical SAM family heme chaperone HemW n=1 Tax=Sphingomonas sp. AP4-R1 TaxID=2735134 RepID=UPI001493480A|nr:radical SAM family heme chaperone HemW [Sphingomonas sp. AP4-R1]QJU56637.1 coproporphyrinogen III oxidase [Sphingomonas sp. AP4-R1]
MATRTHSHVRPEPVEGRAPGESSAAQDALALYVHWPFCVSKCPYCDFNSHVREGVDQDRWRQALLTDLAFEAEIGPKRPLTSIFFGGGTPSLMPPATVAAILRDAERRFGFTPGIEITLEANPSSVEAARFADLATAGVNRVSLGLQALDDEVLRFLGRAHGVEEGLKALETAQACFDRVSFDLIYARPGQSEAEWAMELERALGFGTGHLSLYQLTIEPGTRFATLAAQGKLAPVDPDHGAALFELTREMTAAAGLPAYEVSNHARPGEESRHNLTYWRYGDYLGVGPGAHGRREGVATVRAKKPENWLSRIDSQTSGIAEEERLDPATQATEALLMGLRLEEGVSLARCAPAIDPAAMARLIAQGLLERKDDRLRVTPGNVLVLDGILGALAI